jgi:membrane protease YdiL (CAAX protease family)
MATLHEPPAGAPPKSDTDAPPPFPWYAPFLTGLAVFLGAGIVVAIVGVAAGWDAGDIPDRAVLFATLGQDLALIGGVAAVAALVSRRPRWDLGLRRHIRAGRSLLLAITAFVVFFAFLLIWTAALNIEQSDDLASQLGANDSTFNLVFVAVLVSVVAPIAEELFFRGFLFGALRGVVPWVVAAIVSGACFGLVHAGGTDAVFLVPLGVLGFVLCVLYRRTGSLLPGMGVHAFNNALALASTLHWTAGQGVAAVIAAPVLTLAIATLASVRAPRVPGPWLPPAPP